MSNQHWQRQSRVVDVVTGTGQAAQYLLLDCMSDVVKPDDRVVQSDNAGVKNTVVRAEGDTTLKSAASTDSAS